MSDVSQHVNRYPARRADVSPEGIEIGLLLEGIYRRYGFDFRDYAFPSIRRRIRNMLLAERLESISELQRKILYDLDCMERFLLALTVNVTSMFRDPSFYLSFRSKAVPLLRTYPFIRIWHAGCCTGEEVFSMAILLEEEGLYSRCRIYATDMNEAVLLKAKAGIYPISLMQEYTGNYVKAGGKRSFSDYYTAAYDNAIFRQSLKQNLVFAQHNLGADGSPNEFNVILCRNVMIYFNGSLQKRVYELLHESLAAFGFLGLGSKESIRFSPYEDCYEEVDGKERLYKRVR